MPANARIAELQSDLGKLGFDPGPVDGWRGAKTIAATKAFQKAAGLVADGVAGPMTLTAIRAALAPADPGAKPEPDKGAMTAPSPAAVAPAYGAGSRHWAVPLVMTARRVTEIIVHCTATPEGRDYTVDDIRAWHKARGWSDVGYHYIVHRNGHIAVGRPVGQVGAHCEGRNTGTIGVSYIGGLAADGKAAKDTRTREQRGALLWLIAELAAMYPVRRISGHNEYAAKACPSFDVRADPLGNIPGFRRGRRI